MEVSADQLLAEAVESLAKARLTLTAVSKSWHRKSEEGAIQYCIEQLDRAGIAISGLQGIAESQ